MTIGFESKNYAIQNIKACLHPGDNTRPHLLKIIIRLLGLN